MKYRKEARNASGSSSSSQPDQSPAASRIHKKQNESRSNSPLTASRMEIKVSFAAKLQVHLNLFKSNPSREAHREDRIERNPRQRGTREPRADSIISKHPPPASTCPVKRCAAPGLPRPSAHKFHYPCAPFVLWTFVTVEPRIRECLSENNFSLEFATFMLENRASHSDRSDKARRIGATLRARMRMTRLQPHLAPRQFEP